MLFKLCGFTSVFSCQFFKGKQLIQLCLLPKINDKALFKLSLLRKKRIQQFLSFWDWPHCKGVPKKTELLPLAVCPFILWSKLISVTISLLAGNIYSQSLVPSLKTLGSSKSYSRMPLVLNLLMLVALLWSARRANDRRGGDG